MSSIKKRERSTDKIIKIKNLSAEDIGLMQFIGNELPDISRTTIKSWLRHGNIRVDGIVISQFDFPVKKNIPVEISPRQPFAVLKHPRLQLVYEDDDIIVVNKGYGLLSVGTDSAKKQETAYGILKEYVKKQRSTNKIFVVHRLDRGTSGLMMFAKNVEAKETLQHNWKNMVLQRKYVAVLQGILEQDNGSVKSYLHETSQYEMYSSEAGENGKLAVTRFKVLRRGSRYSLVEFQLETGRKNQIRIHCKDMGHPIVGDRKYGANSSPLNRIALHAYTLKFVHPKTRKLMNFELPVPARFSAISNR